MCGGLYSAAGQSPEGVEWRVVSGLLQAAAGEAPSDTKGCPGRLGPTSSTPKKSNGQPADNVTVSRGPARQGNTHTHTPATHVKARVPREADARPPLTGREEQTKNQTSVDTEVHCTAALYTHPVALYWGYWGVPGQHRRLDDEILSVWCGGAGTVCLSVCL